MRFLHTSDWHLGRSLKGVDLIDAQEAAMAFLVQLAREREVDAVLVSGDIYDRAIPPVEAVRLLEVTLGRLAVAAPVIVTSGNHDSATRLGFGAPMFVDRLHIRTKVVGVAEPVVLTDDAGEVGVYPLPYLDPDEVRHLARSVEGVDVERSHQAAMGYAIGKVREDIARSGRARNLVMAHAFVVPAGGTVEQSESERDISVGGVEAVSAEVFEGIDYVALGHLHGAQSGALAAGGTSWHYPGSPLRYSFSEAEQRKTATIVDIDAQGNVVLERVSVPQPRGMARLRGPIDDFLAAESGGGPFRDHLDDWVQITVTDRLRPSELGPRLRKVFAHALVVRHEPDEADGALTVTVGQRVGRRTTPAQVLASFFEEVGGAPPSEAEAAVIQAAIESVFGGVEQ